MYNEHHINTKLQSTGWIIDARWYYAPLAYFLGVVSQVSVNGVNAMAALTVSVITVLVLNLYFFFAIKKKRFFQLTNDRINILNIGQIGLDLVFFFIVVLFTGGGVESIGHSFFFIPIVASMIIFGFHGTVSVAVFSGILVTLSVLAHGDFFFRLMVPNSIVTLTNDLEFALIKSGIIFLVYILTGFFGGYISRLIGVRDQLLIEQINKSEEHVIRLENLTKEFDMSAKLLVRRDLELTSANEKLTQLDKMKSEIISVVAHQLRTPLSAIKWTLKILLDGDAGPVSKEQNELLHKGFDSNERMITLVNDMLAVDRLESGKLKYNFVPVQIEELIQEMIRNLLPLATQKNIRVEFSTGKELLPKVKIDPDKMRDVFQNLIDNAIKYTKNDGLISIGVGIENDMIHFWVKDNGIGIPSDEREKLFSRFYRADNAIHTQTDGSGLGLFIAMSVVKRHGGKLWFDSVLNEGSTFHLELPLNT